MSAKTTTLKPNRHYGWDATKYTVTATPVSGGRYNTSAIHANGTLIGYAHGMKGSTFSGRTEWDATTEQAPTIGSLAFGKRSRHDAANDLLDAARRAGTL